MQYIGELLKTFNSMSDTSSFSIQNPKQIISHLSLLLRRKNLLRVHFGANNESYITTLLGISEKKNSLVFDYGPREYLNQQIIHADKVTFETEYMGIKVSFSGTALQKISYEEDNAFIMPIPKVLFWMERREFFRVKIPLSSPSFCQMILKDEGSVNIKLHGISLSGFSLLDDDKAIFNQMISGASFEQCKLVLSETVEEDIAFEVRYNHLVNPDRLQKNQKIGCKFIKPTRSVENTIQGYMQQIQREDLQGQDCTQNWEKMVSYRKILIYVNEQ